MFLDYFYRLNRAIGHALARAADALSRAGATITAPIEWLFAATFGRFLRMFERFECVEDWLLGLVRLATWPFRFAARVLASLARLIVPASAFAAMHRWYASTVHWHRRLGPAMWVLAERLNLDAPLRWCAWLLQPLWRPLASLGGFAYAWALTRPYKKMLWGAPVLLVLLPLVAAAAWSLTWGRESLAGQYRVAADRAREGHDYETMEILERKLEQLGVDSNHSNYESALALAKEGKMDEAYERMQLLAPTTSLGYPLAHHWIIVQLLSGALDVPEEKRLGLADAHIRHLDKLGIKSPGLDLLRANYLAQLGRLEEATALLEPHINRMEVAALQRMSWDLKLHRMEEARRDARALTLHFEQAQRDGKRFDAERLQAWAQAAQLLGNKLERARLVRAWLAVDPDDELARKNVVEIDRREFDEMLRSTRLNADELAKRLTEIMQLIENPTSLEPQIVYLYGLRVQSPALAEMFQLLIDAKDGPPALTAAIGTAAAAQGDVQVARRLLGQVVAADDRNAIAWNNYAWALAQDPDKDLDKALAAANRALALSPDEFRFRETRGQILVALAQWQEAVDDLEFALNGMPDVKTIHSALATAYDHLGDKALADIHRQQIQ